VPQTTEVTQGPDERRRMTLPDAPSAEDHHAGDALLLRGPTTEPLLGVRSSLLGGLEEHYAGVARVVNSRRP